MSTPKYLMNIIHKIYDKIDDKKLNKYLPKLKTMDLHYGDDRIFEVSISYNKFNFVKELCQFLEKDYQFSKNILSGDTYSNINFIELFSDNPHFKKIFNDKTIIYDFFEDLPEKDIDIFINKIKIPHETVNYIFETYYKKGYYKKIHFLMSKYKAPKHINDFMEENKELNEINDLFEKLSNNNQLEFLIKKIRLNEELLFLSPYIDESDNKLFANYKNKYIEFKNKVDKLISEIINNTEKICYEIERYNSFEYSYYEYDNLLKIAASDDIQYLNHDKTTFAELMINLLEDVPSIIPSEHDSFIGQTFFYSTMQKILKALLDNKNVTDENKQEIEKVLEENYN